MSITSRPASRKTPAICRIPPERMAPAEFPPIKHTLTAFAVWKTPGTPINGHITSTFRMHPAAPAIIWEGNSILAVTQLFCELTYHPGTNDFSIWLALYQLGILTEQRTKAHFQPQQQDPIDTGLIDLNPGDPNVTIECRVTF